jgi:hypothetical protein
VASALRFFRDLPSFRDDVVPLIYGIRCFPFFCLLMVVRFFLQSIGFLSTPVDTRFPSDRTLHRLKDYRGSQAYYAVAHILVVEPFTFVSCFLPSGVLQS